MARLAMAAAFLAFGTLIYVLARPAADVPFLPAGLVIGAVTLPPAAGSLPTFFHVLAFALATGAALPPGRHAAAVAALAWVAIDGLFELAQHPLAAGLLGTHWATFRLAGTFDPLDLAMAALGGLAAHGLLRVTGAKET
jgi:hypothetical protein